MTLLSLMESMITIQEWWSPTSLWLGTIQHSAPHYGGVKASYNSTCILFESKEPLSKDIVFLMWKYSFFNHRFKWKSFASFLSSLQSLTKQFLNITCGKISIYTKINNHKQKVINRKEQCDLKAIYHGPNK